MPAVTTKKTANTPGALVKKLMDLGLRTEEIAVKLDVSNNTVIRWRSGVTPHRAHLARLMDLFERTSAKAKSA